MWPNYHLDFTYLFHVHFLVIFFQSYTPSQADVTSFAALAGAPASSHAHALRWYNHIKSFGAETSKFPGAKVAAAPAAAPAAAAADDDDDVDLFASDDDEDVKFCLKLRRKKSVSIYLNFRPRLLPNWRKKEWRRTLRKKRRSPPSLPNPPSSSTSSPGMTKRTWLPSKRLFVKSPWKVFSGEHVRRCFIIVIVW